MVERVFEYGGRDAAAVEHQIFADVAATIGEAVGKLFIGAEQKEARSLGAVRANDYGFGFLALEIALRGEINGAGGPAGGVQLDAVHIGIRADFAFDFGVVGLEVGVGNGPIG